VRGIDRNQTTHAQTRKNTRTFLAVSISQHNRVVNLLGRLTRMADVSTALLGHRAEHEKPTKRPAKKRHNRIKRPQITKVVLKRQSIEVDVTTAKNHTHTLASKDVWIASDRGKGNRRRRLDDQFETGPQHLHGRHDFNVRHGENP